MTPSESLASGIEQLGLQISVTDQEKLLTFTRELKKWNQRFNLTAITDDHEMVTHHLLDSLSLAPFIEGKRIIDIGSGAGLPGIPLAIYFPEKQFVLLDSNNKKTRFLTHITHVLELKNIEVVHARAEQYHAEQGFDAVITRAFSDLHDMLAKTKHLVNEGGEFFAMKGRVPIAELEALDASGQYRHQEATLNVPFLDAHRVLIRISAHP